MVHPFKGLFPDDHSYSTGVYRVYFGRLAVYVSDTCAKIQYFIPGVPNTWTIMRDLTPLEALAVLYELQRKYTPNQENNNEHNRELA